MKQTVWKTTHRIGDVNKVRLPAGALVTRIETRQDSPDHVDAWWHVYLDNEVQESEVVVLGTGHFAPESALFLGTAAPHRATGLVWHLWMLA